ncbi:MAG: glycolate oxidase subunit GlcF [Gammaproteobacteria bacterium]|nr:glycolate oxidase subunit GlcF [Gammaproteobacteria bacterium]
MKTTLAQEFKTETKFQVAEDILQACVHCGFCTATCPTYLQLGDERDSPRGRIYMMKAMFEGEPVSATTREHLDRCLTCRSCETTCPSGVKYGHLVDLGREVVEQKAPRPWYQRLLRWSLRQVLPYRWRFGPLLRLGQLFRPLLPPAIKGHVPKPVPRLQAVVSDHQRIMLSMPGCAQASAAPNTDLAAAKVLHKLGIKMQVVQQTGCCGAVDIHLNAHEQGLAKARINIDALWPHITAGAEAIVVTASGCGATLQEYGYLLRNDQQYADKAAKVAELCRDVADILATCDLSKLNLPKVQQRIAVHCPCSQQHGMQLPGRVKAVLASQGFDLTKTKNDHLCCGSAGTYSLLQPKLSSQLRSNKLADLSIDNPDLIVTANIGCQLHLGGHAKVPVKHWIELLVTD